MSTNPALVPSVSGNANDKQSHWRLVVVTHFYPSHGGGIEIVAGKIIEQLIRNNVKVRWFSSKVDMPYTASAQNLECVPIRASNIIERLTQLPYPVWSPLALPRLWNAIGAADIVHVHEHLYVGSIAALVIGRLRGRPVVITQHMGALRLGNKVLTALYERGARILGRLLFPLAARRVFISANVRRFFGREIDPDSTLIFNGIDSRLFRVATDEERMQQRAALAIAPGQKVVLFVGRFVRKKGLHIVEELTKRFPSVLWIIIGAGPVDPTVWKRPNVRLTGRLSQDQLPDYYSAADVMLLPSSGEGFPLVVQEALCCGTGVLSTAEVVSACPPVSKMMRGCAITHGATEVDAWEKALAEMLSDDAVAEARCVRSQQARALWSWEACAGQYLDIFANLVERPTP